MWRTNSKKKSYIYEWPIFNWNRAREHSQRRKRAVSCLVVNFLHNSFRVEPISHLSHGWLLLRTHSTVVIASTQITRLLRAGWVTGHTTTQPDTLLDGVMMKSRKILGSCRRHQSLTGSLTSIAESITSYRETQDTGARTLNNCYWMPLIGFGIYVMRRVKEKRKKNSKNSLLREMQAEPMAIMRKISALWKQHTQRIIVGDSRRELQFTHSTSKHNY